MRLFVGIDLPEEIKETLHRLTLQLERSSSAGSFVPLENYHLTLAFIGESGRAAEIKDILEKTAGEYRASFNGVDMLKQGGLSDEGFDLTISGVGSFKQRKGHTWWLGIDQGQGLERLKTLQRMIVAALREAGFDIQKRAYTPHITLARSVQTKGLVGLQPQEIVFPVEEFCLFSSRAVNSRQEYTVLESFLL